MLYGIDVSHHQKPASLDWEAFAEGADFVIARACYGTRRDREFAEHIRRARDAGLFVGAYLFFRPDQPVKDQLDTFREAALAAGYGKKGDILPALDFEDDTEKRPIRPSDAPLAKEISDGLFGMCLANPLVYITQRDWGRVGKPDWVLQHPLWVAHYSAPSRLEPATPAGKPWAIWQHRVGPFVPNGPSGYDKAAPLLDQNRANFLPLIGGETYREALETTDPHAPIRELEDADGTNDGMAALLAATLADQARVRSTTELLDELSGDSDMPPPPENIS